MTTLYAKGLAYLGSTICHWPGGRISSYFLDLRGGVCLHCKIGISKLKYSTGWKWTDRFQDFFMEKVTLIWQRLQAISVGADPSEPHWGLGRWPTSWMLRYLLLASDAGWSAEVPDESAHQVLWAWSYADLAPEAVCELYHPCHD